MTHTVNFTRMQDGTREEYLLLEELEREYALALPDRILSSLAKLETGLAGYRVDRYAHSLQTATRALRDGADIELIVAALLHDVGDDLSPYNHAEVAASLLRPYVRPEVTWIVEQHGLFQSYYFAHHYGRNRDARERFRGHRWFDSCAAFCANWDQTSFDPAYPTEPIERFVPMVREIFTRPAHDPRFVGETL
jgi:predicted HD phosphohydrolase